MTIRSIAMFTSLAWLAALSPCLAQTLDSDLIVALPAVVASEASSISVIEEGAASTSERAVIPVDGFISPHGEPALPSDELAALSGADGAVAAAVSMQNLQAVNTGNRLTADQVVTGAISLNSAALSGFSGVGNFVMNTGNMNNIQSTLSVSVVAPPR